MKPLIENKRLLAGGILVLVGVAFLLDNFGVLSFIIPDWLFTWPMILIGIGVFSLLTNDNPTPGIVLCSIGLFFILPEWFDVTRRQIFSFWPLILIAIGVSILLRGKKSDHGFSKWRGRMRSEHENDIDYIDEVLIFSGTEKSITSSNFKGGRITTIFGGGELDLMSAELAEGEVYLDIFTMFGGAELLVPPHWNIKTNVTPVFGGLSDKRPQQDMEITDQTRTLIIKGSVVFGGIEIKSYKSRK